MRLLLTNDDSIHAPGLAALERALEGLGELTVVAPDRPWSGCGHRVTVDACLTVEPLGPRRFALSGTPADCVRVALDGLAERPDVVLSGVNMGGNLGVDVFHSGTVAAAREAALHGLPAIAVSHHKKPELDFRWEDAAGWLRPVLEELLAERVAPGRYWNVNLPCLAVAAPTPRVVRCPLDLSPMPISYSRGAEGLRYCGNYHARARLPGHDVDVCFRGDISVSLVGGA
jgi:5'-nucleotidase